MAGTYEIPAIGSPNSSQEPKIKTMLEGLNNGLNTENDWTTESIAKGNLGRLYKPSIVATEQTRESATFGTLTTPDEVKEVVLPENGLIVIDYVAKVKNSVGEAGRVAIFIGSNQLKRLTTAAVEELKFGSSTEFGTLSGASYGLYLDNSSPTAFSTTGVATATPSGLGGSLKVFAAAGTYNVSVQYKATSGSVTAKERKLWVGVVGV